MSVFNQFQRELQKIGSRPNQLQAVPHDDTNPDLDTEQLREDLDDMDDPYEGHKSAESEDDLEQSVVYSAGGNIFDQPHRAVYGIKKAKNMF